MNLKEAANVLLSESSDLLNSADVPVMALPIILEYLVVGLICTDQGRLFIQDVAVYNKVTNRAIKDNKLSRATIDDSFAS